MLLLKDKLRRHAIKCLTRREYSRFELWQKLKRIASDEETLIAEILDDLQQQKWQSDRRYAEMHVNARLQQGYGPLRIEQELTIKQVDSDIIQAALDEHEAFAETWLKRCWQKKFQQQLPLTAEIKQKQLRFLLYRGFSSESAQRWLRKQQMGVIDEMD